MAAQENIGLLNAMANAVRAALNADANGANLGMIMKVYQSSGTPPANSGLPVNGTLLWWVTINSTNVGLVFDAAVNGILMKPAGSVWSGVIVNGGGTPDYFRLTSRDDDPTLNDVTGSKKRVQGSVGLNGCDLNVSPLALVNGTTRTIDEGFFYAIPTY